MSFDASTHLEWSSRYFQTDPVSKGGPYRSLIPCQTMHARSQHGVHRTVPESTWTRREQTVATRTIVLRLCRHRCRVLQTQMACSLWNFRSKSEKIPTFLERMHETCHHPHAGLCFFTKAFFSRATRAFSDSPPQRSTSLVASVWKASPPLEI